MTLFRSLLTAQRTTAFLTGQNTWNHVTRGDSLRDKLLFGGDRDVEKVVTTG